MREDPPLWLRPLPAPAGVVRLLFAFVPDPDAFPDELGLLPWFPGLFLGVRGFGVRDEPLLCVVSINAFFLVDLISLNWKQKGKGRKSRKKREIKLFAVFSLFSFFFVRRKMDDEGGKTKNAPMMRCYYEVLSVERDATLDDIKIAYKKAALKWHPGTYFGDNLTI